MKNLLSINQTAATGKPDGAAFITHQTSPEMLRQMHAVHREGTELRKGEVPLWLGFVRWGSFLGAALLSGDVLRQEISIPAFLSRSPGLFVLDVLLLLVFLLSFPAVQLVWKRHRRSTIRTADEGMHSLAIPSDGKRMDFLCYAYRDENGTEQRDTVWMNQFFQTYIRHGNLCLSNLLFTLEIPLESLYAVHPPADTAAFRGWAKPEPPAQHGVTERDGFCFVQYGIAEIRDTKGDFCLMLPAYELQAFCTLTGISLSSPPENPASGMPS